MKKRVHFMGIGGSGIAAAAMLAHAQSFSISGCDIQESSPYLDEIKKNKILVYKGHSSEHVANVDILAVTPAVYYLNKNHEEVKAANKIDVMTWQHFMGSYLHRNKRVICVAGTHGKSTTTTMLSLVYEKASKDPTVMVGANVREWDRRNYRSGSSNIFITEADEFYGNFLNYKPHVIILNNIEFDHPDYFTSMKQIIDTFKKFLLNITSENIVIVNQDSPGVSALLKKLDSTFINKIKIVGYTLKDNPDFEVKDSFKATLNKISSSGTKFTVKNDSRGYLEQFEVKLPGTYNVSNALGVIALSALDDIQVNHIKTVLKTFKGAGRRLELIGKKKKIYVYDDYGHHPTAIKVTLEGLRQKYPKNKIIAIVEPHMFSRTKKLLSEYTHAFESANSVFIAPIFQSRDTKTFGISNQSIVDVAEHDDIKANDSFDDIINDVKSKIVKNSIIIVFGAGKSYQLARDLLKSL